MTQPMQPGFPPNPYAPQGVPAQYPPAPTPSPYPPQPQYAGHTGATPMQAPAPAPQQQWAPPSQYQAPPQQPAPAPAAPPQPAPQFTGLGPSGYGQPPPGAPAPQYAPQPQYAGPANAAYQAAAMQPPPPAQQGYVPPVNWNDPQVYAYHQRTPFVPYVPCQYVMQLLHLRYDAGKYYADMMCRTASHQQAITGSNGLPLSPCVPGQEYSLMFDFTKTGTEVWLTQKAQRHLAWMLGAITREEMTPDLIQHRLNEFVSKSRDQLTALGLCFQLTLTPDTSKNGKPITQYAFRPVSA